MNKTTCTILGFAIGMDVGKQLLLQINIGGGM